MTYSLEAEDWCDDDDDDITYQAIAVTFAYKFHTLFVTSILGQR